VLDAPLVADLLLGIEERGAVDSCKMILSGYLGSPEIAAVVADFVARTRARNPTLLYCCDPVLGIATAACSCKPTSRRWCGTGCARWLISSRPIISSSNGCADEGHDNRSGDRQAQALLARGPIDHRRHQRGTRRHPGRRDRDLAIERSRAWRVRTPKLPISPSGTGDLFAALLVAARVRGSNTPDALGHAASAIFAVLERTAARGTEEMRIVESAEMLVHPKRRFDAVAIRG